MKLMCRMSKSLWLTEKMVIIYSVLCVLKGLIGMYEMTVYGSAVVKKHGYWPSRIYRDQINNHKKKKRGEHGCQSGNWKGVGFDVFVVKETNCNMILMSTYSGIMTSQLSKGGILILSKGQVLTLKYAELFSHHYLYRGSVDNHDAMRH